MEREVLEVDILIVGGGPSGMSAALRLAQMQKAKGGEPLAIAVLEKAREAGAHMMSGAVLDPSTLKDLIPNFKEKGAPLAAEVSDEHMYFLTAAAKLPLPFIPPPFQNHGNYVISLNKFVAWLGEQVEAEGIDFFSGFPGTEVLYDGDRVIGVRTGDRGIGKHGERKPNFEPGVDIHAKVTIFCDGVRGNLTKTLVSRLKLDDQSEPQQYAVGIKELWEVPAGRIKAGEVIHTLGYPLKPEEFGGSFIYGLPNNQVVVGLVVGLDYKDPLFEPHAAFNRLKQHALVRNMLDGGKMVRYGAKALPEGGWHTSPRVYMDGALIAGDAGAFVNSMRLKGIHLAMRTGMLAAETAFRAVHEGDTSAARLAEYKRRIDEGPVKKELYPIRSVHQAFGLGFIPGVLNAGLSMYTNGMLSPSKIRGHAGHERIQVLKRYHGREGDPASVPAASNATPTDKTLAFEKLTDVHYSATAHEEDQPSHLLVQTDVCHTKCGSEFGYPCVRFCPASVYEMVDNGSGGKKLQINAANCVHCKTCDIMDPYQAITWVPPEGGGGPQYNGM
ncbi:MAG: 4Fe-4S dicluster domain-containing protein [Vicinamibacterales bacterium]